MKHVFFTSLAIAALVFVSCNVETPEMPLNEEVEMEFNASCSDWEPESKTVRQQDGKVFWSPGETIGIFQGNGTQEGGYKFVSQNNTPQAQVVFKGTMFPGNGDYWGIYPYTTASFLYQNDYIVTTLPVDQTGVPGTFPDDLYIAVARSSSKNLTFSHPLGGIKFSVTGSGITRAVLISNGGEPFAAEQLLIQHTGGVANVVDYYNGFNTLYLLPEGGSFVPGEAYYFVTMPISLNNGFTLVFEKPDGSFMSRNVDKAVSIPRATFRTLMNADEGYQYSKPALAFTPEAVSVGAKGGTFQLTVNYTGQYHIDASACDWITETASEKVGYGAFSHTFKVTANTGSERNGVITVCDESNCYPVIITQADGSGTKMITHHSLGMRFTATWCGYCPMMNESFAMAKQQLGDKFEIVNLHAANSNLPFSQTSVLASQYLVGGYPTGIVDGRALIENYTQSYAAQLIVKAVNETEDNYPACTSVGLSTAVSNRTVNATVKVFSGEPGDYKLTVLLLEDNIVGYQADYINGAQNSYVHNNTARVMMNNTITGDLHTASGTNATDSYEFSATVPDNCNIANMKILAYVQKPFGTRVVLQSGNYGDWYIDNCRVAPLGTTVEPEVQ